LVTGCLICVVISLKSPRRIRSVGTDAIGLVVRSERWPSYAAMKNVLLRPS
jgi:hypothetical protein